MFHPPTTFTQIGSDIISRLTAVSSNKLFDNVSGQASAQFVFYYFFFNKKV